MLKSSRSSSRSNKVRGPSTPLIVTELPIWQDEPRWESQIVDLRLQISDCRLQISHCRCCGRANQYFDLSFRRRRRRNLVRYQPRASSFRKSPALPPAPQTESPPSSPAQRSLPEPRPAFAVG